MVSGWVLDGDFTKNSGSTMVNEQWMNNEWTMNDTWMKNEWRMNGHVGLPSALIAIGNPPFSSMIFLLEPSFIEDFDCHMWLLGIPAKTGKIHQQHLGW
jgi:hypothetical protein